MKYIIVSTINMIFDVEYANDEAEMLQYVNGIPIDKIRVYEIAREVELEEQLSIRIKPPSTW